MTATITDTLEQLQLQFLEQLNDKLNSICSQYQGLDRAAWPVSEAEELHLKVHNLTGSAGTFGMQVISDAARSIESRLAIILKTGKVPGENEWQTIGTDLVHLQQLARNQLDTNAPVLSSPSASKIRIHSSLVYIVEDDPEQCIFIGQVLHEAGYKTRLFTDIEKFRDVFTSADFERPAAVVMDMKFPDGDNAGALIIRELGLGNENNIPVLILSIRDDLEGRLIALRAGASRYLTKPIDKKGLVESLDVITGRQPHQPYRVLLVDDDPLLLEAQAAVLNEAGMIVKTLSEPLRTIEATDDFSPDVIVLDVYMPGATGPELAAVLRERDSQLHIPILFLSSEADMTEQLLALNLGGDDFLVKPVQPDHLIAAVSVRARRARQNSAIRRRLEIALYEREREHLAVDQHAIISIADQNGSITYVNDKFCETSGYSRDELLGQNHRIIKSDNHPAGFFQGLWQTISHGNVWQGEVCNRRKDGKLYWVESTITPFLNSKGKPYQYVSIRTEITHVKQAELELLESQENLRATLDATMDGILAVNNEGQINFVNQQFVQMWQVPDELKEQSNIQGFLKYAASLLNDPDTFLTKAQELTTFSGDSYDILEFHDGRLFEHHSRPLMKKAQTCGRVWSFRDFTERKRAEQSLVKARDEAERANMAKSEFLSSMSHELRTPMNAILGFGQLMEYDDMLPDDAKDSTQEILKAGNHLLRLINEVLDLSRVESGHIEMSLEPVEVDLVVEESLNLMATLAGKRNIQLSYKGLAGAVVRADRTRLKQVLLNLLSNAIKYNHEGGSVKLEISDAGNDQLRIQVMDTGPGIPNESLEDLFQPFNRLGTENSAIEGTGIGLTLTRRIVELMGGVVDVHSEVGVGSCFWVDLPLESLDESVMGKEQSTAISTLPGQIGTSDKNTVLYIEDNPSNLKLVAQILNRRKNIHLFTSHTPELGIELARTQQPQLILLDINLPGMNGYQVMDVIKKDATLKNTPVVAITANAMPRDIKRGMAAGFIDYLTKPLDIKRFHKIIDKVLQNNPQETNAADV